MRYFLNFAGLDAGSTDLGPLHCSVGKLDSDLLKIREKTALSNSGNLFHLQNLHSHRRKGNELFFVVVKLCLAKQL